MNYSTHVINYPWNCSLEVYVYTILLLTLVSQPSSATTKQI
uniref:Uncharacterized protein n=1 Tax=Arundo donax TaxID=35708 RepID=A0A0A9ASN5_ARUDO